MPVPVETERSVELALNELLELDFRPADERVVYGRHPAQHVEVWRPTGPDGRAPVVVLFHGGCWKRKFDLSHVRPLASAIARHGYVVWAPEYRRLGDDGGGWPGTFEDAGRAIDLLGRYEDSRLDTSRVVLAGHSAGGHLALWAAGRSRLEPGQALHVEHPFRPRGVIGLAAITDLHHHVEGSDGCQEEVLELMGGKPSERPDRYAQSSPATLGSDVPLILLHGTDDRVVPCEQAGAMNRGRRVLLESTDHFDMIHPDKQAFTTLIRALGELIDP